MFSDSIIEKSVMEIFGEVNNRFTYVDANCEGKPLIKQDIDHCIIIIDINIVSVTQCQVIAYVPNTRSQGLDFRDVFIYLQRYV